MIMKKCIEVLIVLLFASSSYAQVSFDARVGGNLSGIPEGDFTMKFGAKAGLGIDIALSEPVALKSGVFFSMKGVSNGKTPFDFFPENRKDLNYLEIPVLASFRFPISSKFSIALNAGPSICYLVSKKPEGMTEMSSTDVGANGGVDFEFNKKIIIGIESQIGLSELNKDSKQHIVNYSLMLGYKF